MESSPLLPNRICGSCSASLTPTIHLIEFLREARKKWVDVTEYIERMEVKVNAKTAYIMVDDQAKDITTYTENVRRNITDKTEVYKCFKKRKAQQNAVRRRNELERKLRDAEIANCLRCPECGKSFLCVYKFNAHMRYNDQRACVHCRQMMKVDELKKHYEGHDVDTLQCDICFDTFKKPDAFVKHKVTYHSKGPYFCYICKLSYRDPHHLSSHMTSKHEPRICLGCNQKFSNGYCFRTHTRKCRNAKRKGGVFICDICSKVYSSKYALKVHLEYIHMNKEHSHQCEHCGKVFNSAVHLLEHSNTHNKVPDRFICDVCDMPMSTRRGYQRHIKRHMKNPNYKPRRSKPPNDKSSRRYECDYCDLKFGFKYDLLVHLKSDHKIIEADEFEFL